MPKPLKIPVSRPIATASTALTAAGRHGCRHRESTRRMHGAASPPLPCRIAFRPARRLPRRRADTAPPAQSADRPLASKSPLRPRTAGKLPRLRLQMRASAPCRTRKSAAVREITRRPPRKIRLLHRKVHR